MPSLRIMCVFWRILFFYVFGSLAIGVTVSSDNPNLTAGGVGAKSSPWVIAIQSAGIPALPFHQCYHLDICLFVG
jgi:amino acid transporter